jgi:hypothetical protein
MEDLIKIFLLVKGKKKKKKKFQIKIMILKKNIVEVV